MNPNFLFLRHPYRAFFLTRLALVSFFLLNSFCYAFAEPDFLEPEQAFQFSSKQIAPNKVEVTYRIANGYYMYRERFSFKANGATLGEAILPAGHIKFDETFQKDVETYRDTVSIQIPLSTIDQSNPTFTLISTSQGCSDQGLCYTPMEQNHTFNTVDFALKGDEPVKQSGADANIISTSLQSGNLPLIISTFLLLGLGLSLTPCVLPMVPILSSIIVGEGKHVKRMRGFILSLSYSLGMAIVYTGLGIAAGLAGEGLAALLQNPWVLGAFGLLMVLLALSMFNVYQIQVPSVLQNQLSRFSHGQRAGKLAGVFMMGAISALIVGPCVAAPLAGALLFISQTHNVVIGGTALFSMAIGMSVPLLLVGLSAGSLLPRAGAWMESIKRLFGVLMLAMALWLVSPVLPAWLQMLGWSALLIGYSYFLFRHSANLGKGMALILGLLGLIELTGLATGGRDVFAPLAHLSGKVPAHRVVFERINSSAELDDALAQAKSQGKIAMLDFYADWCVACKEMEKFTFTDQRVLSELDKMTLLQVDVTANNDNDRALLKRFNLFGPPGIIFFSLESKETGRVIGFENADKFMNSLSKL